MLKIHKVYVVLIAIMITMVVYAIIKEIPQRPQIIYGEFPFCVEYEIDGERIVVSDTVICEYNGVNYGSNGAKRNWIKRLSKRGTEDLLLLSEENKKIYCTVGDADYYMGDSEETKFIPVLYIEEYDSELKMTTHKSYIEKDEKHKIKLLSFEFAEPIVNSF